MTVAHLTPYIRVAHDQLCPTGLELAPRVILDHYLACVADGTLWLDIAGRRHTLTKGDFVFIQPKEIHTLSSPAGKRLNLPHLHFDFFTLPDASDVFISFKLEDQLQEYAALFRRPIRDEVPELQFATITQPLHYEKPLEHLMRAIELQGQTSAAARIEQHGQVLQLLAILLHASHAADVLHHPRHLAAMERAIALIRSDYSQPLTLELLAEAVHLSPSHFSHLFKQYHQTSPMQFLRNTRIEQVKRHMLTSNLTLTQIAKRCGFSSIHTLSRAFKEVTHMSPTAFLAGTQNSKP